MLCSKPAAVAGKKNCILMTKTLRELTRVQREEKKSSAVGWKNPAELMEFNAVQQASCNCWKKKNYFIF